MTLKEACKAAFLVAPPPTAITIANGEYESTRKAFRTIRKEARKLLRAAGGVVGNV